jgi:hypothetical protein
LEFSGVELFFRDLAKVRFLKLLAKLLPSDAPPATGGKTPMGKDIFSQPKTYLSVYDEIFYKYTRQSGGEANQKRHRRGERR